MQEMSICRAPSTLDRADGKAGDEPVEEECVQEGHWDARD